MTSFQKTLFTLALAAACGTAVYKGLQASDLRGQVRSLKQQQSQLSDQAAGLKQQNESLVTQLTKMNKTREPSVELLKLRNKAAQVSADKQELESLKSTTARGEALNKAMEHGVSMSAKIQKDQALGKLARMKAKLNLSEKQEQAIKDLMTKNIESRTQKTQALLSGQSNIEELSKNHVDEDAQIKELLSSDQLASFQEFKKEESDRIIHNIADNEASLLASEFNLSKEQQEQLGSSLFQSQTETVTLPDNIDRSNSTNIYVEMEKARLEKTTKVLQSLLTPEQLATYRQEKIEEINSRAEHIKNLFPKKHD